MSGGSSAPSLILSRKWRWGEWRGFARCVQQPLQKRGEVAAVIDLREPMKRTGETDVCGETAVVVAASVAVPLAAAGDLVDVVACLRIEVHLSSP
jgi:hypothetical protein